MPDTSFSGDGLLTSDIANGESVGRRVIVQPNGKIVILASALQGQFDAAHHLVRYNQDGSLDISFGLNGKTLPFPAAAHRDLILQADGKILVVGMFGPGQRIMVVRYNSNGTLDSSFGASGMVTTPIPGSFYSSGSSGALQPDGKIVVLGYGGSFANPEDDVFAMVDTTPTALWILLLAVAME